TFEPLVAASSVLTALIAAGSCGLIGHPLRHALTFLGLLVITVASIGREPGILRRIGILAVFLLVACYLATSGVSEVCALSVVVMLGGVVFARPDSQPAFRPVV